MSGAWYCLRAELRRDWRSFLLLVALVGLAGGATLGALAAARRTDTAFSRMRAATDSWDVMVNPNLGSESRLTLDQIRRLPGVERTGKVEGMMLFPSLVRSVSQAFELPPMLVADGAATYSIGRPVVTAGRQPAAGDPDGVFADRTFAQRLGLHVGQRFHFVVVTPDLLQQIQAVSSPTAAQAILRSAPASQQGTARVDGIGVTQDSVVVNPGYVPAGFVFTPAFRRAHPDLVSPYWGALVRLRPGTDVDAFTARVRALVPDESVAFQRASAITADVANATDPEVFALEAFAALTALLGLVVVTQAIARRMQLDAAQHATLAALGATRVQRAGVAVAKAMLAIVIGALLAIAVAVAVSPLGPVGIVRVAEVTPGVHVDGLVLVAGVAAIVVAGAVVTVLLAWPLSRVRVASPHVVPSRVARTVTAAGGSVSSTVGVRFALERGGQTGVPVRTTLVAAATAVGLVASVVVFSASIGHLVATPRLFGSAWDAQIEVDNVNTPAGFDNLDPDAIVPIERQFVQVADRSGSIARSALLQVGEVRSGALAIPALGYAPSRRGVPPTIAAGRAPADAGEIALGATTMAALHTHIGATIRLAEGEQGPSAPVKVVGRAVLPGLAPYPGSDKAGLGVGAVLTEEGWRRFSPDFQKTQYVFRWAPGASVHTLTKAFARDLPSQLPLTVDDVYRPSGVVSMENLRATPTLLASLVAVLLAASVANAIVVTVRRRRRDLAVLRTLGFTTRQVMGTVLWQAVTVGVAAVVVGIPVGIVLGRWTWALLADHLGALSVPELPVDALVLVAVAAVGLACLVAIVPGRRACGAPAPALRAE